MRIMAMVMRNHVMRGLVVDCGHHLAVVRPTALLAVLLMPGQWPDGGWCLLVGHSRPLCGSARVSRASLVVQESIPSGVRW